VGVPISGREREEVKDIIGFFVNVIVIRADLSLNPNFNELLAQTKLQTLEAFEHQAIPAEMVIDAVQPVRDTSHAPIAQVGFSYTDSVGQGLDNSIPGLSFEALEIETHSAKYDVTLAFTEVASTNSKNDSILYGELEFNTDLFAAETIEKMAEHLTELLTIISEHPQRPVESIQLLTNDALYALLDCSEDDFEAIEPLVSTQQDIFLQSLMNPTGLQNCMGYLTESNGEFDSEIWQQALQLLYQYEPYLRAEFRSADGLLADIAYLCIHKQRMADYQYIDLSTQSNPQAVQKHGLKKPLIKAIK
jgi:non-ribosomal peptide synthetase component F